MSLIFVYSSLDLFLPPFSSFRVHFFRYFFTFYISSNMPNFRFCRSVTHEYSHCMCHGIETQLHNDTWCHDTGVSLTTVTWNRPKMKYHSLSEYRDRDEMPQDAQEMTHRHYILDYGTLIYRFLIDLTMLDSVSWMCTANIGLEWLQKLTTVRLQLVQCVFILYML